MEEGVESFEDGAVLLRAGTLQPTVLKQWAALTFIIFIGLKRCYRKNAVKCVICVQALSALLLNSDRVIVWNDNNVVSSLWCEPKYCWLVSICLLFVPSDWFDMLPTVLFHVLTATLSDNLHLLAS